MEKSDIALPSGDKSLSELQELVELSPCEVWEMFPDMVKTNLYAKRDINNPNLETTVKDVRNLLGILLLSGHHIVPKQHCYWSTQPDLDVPAMYNRVRTKFWI